MFSRWHTPPPRDSSSQPLTNKAFYDLSNQCREFALELARYDPVRVNLELCHRYNAWLPTVRRYDRLRRLKSARPVARWQVMTLSAVFLVILALALAGRVERSTYQFILSGGTLSLLGLLFIPEQLYGTTVELIEARLLFIVETLLTMLISGEVQFSEAAFFKAKETLETTKRELRQQLHLAHNSEFGA